MIADDTLTKAFLIAALCANPLCLPVSGGRQVAIVRDREEWQALVAVSREPQGFVYGHLFADRGRRCWRALLVFSSAAVMTALERASVTAYQQVVVGAMQYEPLYSWTPGDVSLLAATRRTGIRAMAALIAGYSPKLVEPPADAETRPSLDGAIFEAYEIRSKLR